MTFWNNNFGEIVMHFYISAETFVFVFTFLLITKLSSDMFNIIYTALLIYNNIN